MDLVERYCPHCGAAYVAGDAACGACGASLKVTRRLDDIKKRIPLSLVTFLAVHLQTLQLFNERYRIVRQVGRRRFWCGLRGSGHLGTTASGD